jgi:hypothetical protein
MARERTILAFVAAVWLALLVTASALAYQWIGERAQERAGVQLAQQRVDQERAQRYLQEQQSANDAGEIATPAQPGTIRGSKAGDDQQAPQFSPNDIENFPLPLTGPLPKPMPV